MSIPESVQLEQIIQDRLAQLRQVGVGGVDQYERRLKNNAPSESNVDNLLFEAGAALMFRRNGWQATLRERPDLMLTLDGEVVYAEVKHFREKEQDRLDEKALREAGSEWVRVGDLTATEGDPPWKQIADVAAKKARLGQYMDSAPNILVVESSSQSLLLMATSAANEYDDMALSAKEPELSKLNGIMLVHPECFLHAPSATFTVEFCRTSRPVVPLSGKLAAALKRIRFE